MFNTSFRHLLIGCGWLAASLLAQWVYAAPLGQDNAPSARQRGAAFDALERVLNTQSRLIFYWHPDQPSADVATIFVSGSYQASLTPGYFSLLCLDPHAVSVGVRHTRSGDSLKSMQEMHALQPGQTLYLRVSPHAQNGLVVQPVEAAQARRELLATREHANTISRVQTARVCQDLGSAP